MKKIAFILALVMILSSALWGCDTTETDTTGQASDSLENISEETLTQDPTSDEEIINSVLSSLDRHFNSETADSYTSFNFIDDQIGFFFYFLESELKLFMKTTDGGKNWYFQQVNGELSMCTWRERIICAKMVTKNVGLVSGKFHADNDIRNRTYITSNGGLTWYAPDVNYPCSWRAEAYDMLYQNGEYILCFREKYISDGSYEYRYYRCVSKDLKTWTLIEE